MSDVLARLAARSERQGECLVWTGYRNKKGYGEIQIGRRIRRVHREAWIARHGEPPAETPHVLHRCDNPPCWAEEHLWLGTHQDNMADRDAKGRTVFCVPVGAGANRSKTHCPKGHVYDEVNTRITPHGSRICRTCVNRYVLPRAGGDRAYSS